jgi:hypothetical protein
MEYSTTSQSESINRNMRLPVSAAAVGPIYWIALFGFTLSIFTFFPGWMSNDSIIQYREAHSGAFNGWHPVLMAWWWRQLDHLYQGPALFLIQNLMLYWGGWGLLANALRHTRGKYAYFTPLFGLWPALFFVLGEIWKDVAYACCQFLAWTIIINAYCWQRKTFWLERCALVALLSFSIGVKTNGIVATPFLFIFWLHTDDVRFGKRFAGLAVLLTTLVALIPYGITRGLPVKRDNPFQYTQVYDLLAISVKSGHNLLPAYINKRVQLSESELAGIYIIGNNDALFYRLTKDLVGLRSQTASDALILQNSWLNAIREHPGDYLSHRYDLFLSLLRIGQPTAAYVASPLVVQNEFGLSFTGNKMSDWLNMQPAEHPWEFYPWLYFLLTIIALAALFLKKKHRFLASLIGASSLTFTIPHFFIAPASDFRYLYYTYFCSAIVIALAFLPSVAIRKVEN